MNIKYNITKLIKWALYTIQIILDGWKKLESIFWTKLGGITRLWIISPVTAVESKYKCNTVFGDVITVEVGVEEFKGIRLKLSYVMKKGDVVVSEATSEHCFLDAEGKVLNIKKVKPELYETLTSFIRSE